MADGSFPRRRRRRPLAAGLGGLLVVAAATGVTLWATGASGSTGYRTATVTDATVRQTLSVSGSVAPVHEGAADFQVAGTVSKVDVGVGQSVNAGETLASLTTTTLQQDVTAATTTLSAAQATLSENELDESTSGTAGTAGTAGTSGTAGTAGTTADITGSATGSSPIVEDAVTVAAPLDTTPGTRPASTKPSGTKPGGTKPSGTPSLQQAQAAVLAAQKTADADAEQAAAALAQAEATCAGTTPPPSSTTTLPTTTTTLPTTTTTVPASTTTVPASTTTVPASTTTVPASTTTVPATTTGSATTVPASPAAGPATPAATTATASLTSASSPPPTSGSPAACAAALNAALADQQLVASDDRAVSAAEDTLAQVLTTMASSPTHSSSGQTKSATPSSGASRTTGAGSGSATSATGAASNSAQQLASDQAAIDTDQATLIEAQQALADAQLTSPITGTVAAVGLAAGQSVTAGSTTSAITVVNSGSFQATATLTSTQVAEVKVDDDALVSVDGVSGPLAGKVARVGPVDASGDTYTYPVVVALPPGTHGISAGSTAQVQIVLRQVAYALAAPTSAVHTSAAGSQYVLVLNGSQEVRTRVAVGAVGAVYTQILSGVAKGTPVVLADLSEAVPSASANVTTGRFGGATGAGGFSRGAAVGGAAG